MGLRAHSLELEQAAPPSRLAAIYVDVDGTLLRTDLFVESAWRYVRQSLGNVVRLFFLLLRGRAAAKTVVARHVPLDVARLPYEPELIAHLSRRRAEGHRLILVTAANRRYANQIAKHLGLFDAVYASSAKVNLKGRAKLQRILELNGQGPFIYAGDSAADRPIWAASEKVILVNAPRRDVVAAQQDGRADLVVDSRPSLFSSFLRGMRLHQWAKNALVLVPLLASHTYGDLAHIQNALLAFLAFGLCASGHYLLNDLLDLDADRAHARKCKRSLASGDLPVHVGALGALVLPVAAFLLSYAALPWSFTLTLVAYFTLTNAYSFHLKRRSTADVIALAMLYTVRVVAGAMAISVVFSSWLLAVSMFFFLSLAYLKRYIEVSALTDQAKAGGRGYAGEDAEAIFVLGIANATASIIVLALYITRPEVTTFYREPQLLWVLCLLMLWWSNRIWLGARRGKIHDDPIVFAIKDRVSRLVGLAAVATVVAARLIA
jgi:4-hydroxybenzoate polyprenyltransferase/phosphoserine phosphatase